MNTNKFLRMIAGSGQSTNGQGRCVACKKTTFGKHGLRFFCDCPFDFALLKNSFNDEVASLQVLRIVGGLNQVQQSGLLFNCHAAFFQQLLCECRAVRLPLFSLFKGHIF